LAMQCQVIDDVLDYKQDLAAGRPSFLTAASSLPQAMAWTAEAARSYGATCEQSAPGGVLLPLQTALRVITALTAGVLRVARCRAIGSGLAAHGHTGGDHVIVKRE
jgi:hypothetical protein